MVVKWSTSFTHATLDHNSEKEKEEDTFFFIISVKNWTCTHQYQNEGLDQDQKRTIFLEVVKQNNSSLEA